ncbi:serine/threonine protein kinase [Pendulispora brunnea]|uniref:Serine/threonine protein kinase n=1 Tax=Pendulispora brunnea TaxID=2905690 RepID=A0ABZ2K9Q4_9BACT
MAAPELVERSKARVGSVLRDKWRLDSLLGVGGSAAVYAATHRNGKRGAIKLLHPELSVQTDFVTRFLREGYVANKIEHPGAVSILDDDHTEDGTAFLVMELLEGYTLERRLRKQSAFPVYDALKIVEDLLDIVSAAHDKGIIHRDLKPANIFVTKKGEVKVLDFGIARLGEAHHLSGSTQMGMPLGTPAFMPPEQARGRWGEVDVRTDLWAVGATLWALLSGQRPRRAETANEELLLAMTEPLPPIGSVAPHVSLEACKLVDRAVAFDMSARWPNARTMQQALRLALLLEQAHKGEPVLEKPRTPSLPAGGEAAAVSSGGTIAGLGGYIVPVEAPPAIAKAASVPPAGDVVATAASASPSTSQPAPPPEPPMSTTAVRPFATLVGPPSPLAVPAVAGPSRTSRTEDSVVSQLEGPPSLNYGGQLSLSRYDALGERRPRAQQALPGGSNPTPTGETRLLTTETPLMTGARSMLASEPEIAPRRSGFFVSALLVVALAGVGFFAYRSGWLGARATQAAPSPPEPAAAVMDAGVVQEAVADAGAAAAAAAPAEQVDAAALAAVPDAAVSAPTETTAASATAAAVATPVRPKPRPRAPSKPRLPAGEAGGSAPPPNPSNPSNSGPAEGPTPTPIPPFVDPDSNQL